MGWKQDMQTKVTNLDEKLRSLDSTIKSLDDKLKAEEKARVEEKAKAEAAAKAAEATKAEENPFEKLKVDDLVAERIKLEREEKLKVAEVDRLSADRKDLFNKGFYGSEAEKKTLARRIQEVDKKIRLDNIYLKNIGDNTRVIDNLIFLHDNKETVTKAGLVATLLQLPKSKLDEFQTKVDVEDQKLGANREALLNTMEAEYSLLMEPAPERATAKLMDIWATTAVARADETYEKWEKEKGGKKELKTIKTEP